MPGRLSRWLRDARTFPADARAAWRREGPSGVWGALRVRTLDRVFAVGRLLVIENDLRDGPEVPVPHGVTVGPFAGDWEALAGLAGQRGRERFRRASARGRVCFVAWRGPHPIGYTWFAEELDPEFDPTGIALPPGTAYGTDLYVAPAERNAGVGSALLSARLRHARERGFARAWRMVAPSNRPSLRTVEKACGPTLRVVCELRTLRVLGWRRVRVRPAPATHPRAQTGTP